MTVTVTLELRFKPDEVAAGRELMGRTLEVTRAFDGNVRTDVLVDDDDKAHWLIYEIWETVEADEAYRIGLLNHLVPRDQLRAKTMELARLIAANNRSAVIGVKELLLKQKGQNLEEQWTEERDYTTHVVKGARAEEAFPEFIARHGRPLS